LSFELILFVVLFEHSKDNPTNFQVIWSSFDYTCSFTPFMPIPLELMYFGARLGETQVNYDQLTLKLIGPSTEDVEILGIHLCMLIIL